MSGKTILIFGFGLIAFFSKAQILVGPTAGVNVSWISYDRVESKNIYSQTPVIGFHAGATVSFRVRKRFFLNTSLLYSTKGKSERNEQDPLYYNDVKYNFIEMPIVYTAEFKGSFGQDKIYKWYLGLGPNVSYWLGGKGVYSSSSLQELNVQEYPYKIVFNKNPDQAAIGEMVVEEPNRIQLGLNIAAGFVLEPVGFHKIMLVIRYELGHSFLSRDSDGVFVPAIIHKDDMHVRNQGFRVSLSYLFDLKTEERKKGKSTIKKKNK